MDCVCIDEAQWEAYRRLGEYMACHVFGELEAPLDPNSEWRPFDWKPIQSGVTRCSNAVN